MKEFFLIAIAVILSVWCAIETSKQNGTWRAGYEAGVRAGINATIAELERQIAVREATR